MNKNEAKIKLSMQIFAETKVGTDKILKLSDQFVESMPDNWFEENHLTIEEEIGIEKKFSIKRECDHYAHVITSHDLTSSPEEGLYLAYTESGVNFIVRFKNGEWYESLNLINSYFNQTPIHKDYYKSIFYIAKRINK